MGYRLPASLADDTGVIFASAFPGYDQLVQQMDQRRRDELYCLAPERKKSLGA